MARINTNFGGSGKVKVALLNVVQVEVSEQPVQVAFATAITLQSKDDSQPFVGSSSLSN